MWGRGVTVQQLAILQKENLELFGLQNKQILNQKPARTDKGESWRAGPPFVLSNCGCPTHRSFEGRDPRCLPSSSTLSLPRRTVTHVLDLAREKSHSDRVRPVRIATIFSNVPPPRSSDGPELSLRRLRAHRQNHANVGSDGALTVLFSAQWRETSCGTPDHRVDVQSDLRSGNDQLLDRLVKTDSSPPGYMHTPQAR